MPAGGSFQQTYNVQVGVDTESMLIVTEYVTQHANDKQEIEPTLKAIEESVETLGKPEALLSDNGYYSEGNMKACVATNITPYIAAGCEAHHLPVEQRWISPPPLTADANVVEEMKHRLATPEGRAVYAQRKCTVEPVFGIVKSVLGFRQFHLRGLKNVTGEWTLVSIAWNLKRLFNLRQQQARLLAANSLKCRADGRKCRSTNSFRADATFESSNRRVFRIFSADRVTEQDFPFLCLS